MGYRNEGKHLMLDALAAVVTEVSLHDGVTPSDGNEISGGTYSRQTPTFDDAGAGTAGELSHDLLTFDIPGGNTVRSAAYRIGDGTIVADGELEEETFAGDGEYNLSDASVLHLNNDS